MNPKDVERTLQKVQTVPPPDSLDQRVAGLLGQHKAATGPRGGKYSHLPLWQT